MLFVFNTVMVPKMPLLACLFKKDIKQYLTLPSTTLALLKTDPSLSVPPSTRDVEVWLRSHVPTTGNAALILAC